MREQLEAMRTYQRGGACVNDTVLQPAARHLPFGGVGASGMGRYHGRHGFELLSHFKNIVRRGPGATRPCVTCR